MDYTSEQPTFKLEQLTNSNKWLATEHVASAGIRDIASGRYAFPHYEGQNVLFADGGAVRVEPNWELLDLILEGNKSPYDYMNWLDTQR